MVNLHELSQASPISHLRLRNGAGVREGGRPLPAVALLPSRPIGLSHLLGGRGQVDRGRLEASVPHLLLHYWKRQTSVHHVVHYV